MNNKSYIMLRTYFVEYLVFVYVRNIIIKNEECKDIQFAL